MKQLLFVTAGIVLLLSPRPTWAHALGAQWQIKGDKVVLEAYFSDDTPAQAAHVRIIKKTDPKGPDPEKVLLEVKTDEKGVCSFPRPEPGTYRIVVEAGAGHRKELTMEIVETHALIPSIILACGSPSLGGLENLSLVPILALESKEPVAVSSNDGPSRAEFTSYPWQSVIIASGSLVLIALIFWLLRTSQS